MDPKTAYETLLKAPESFLKTRFVVMNGGKNNGPAQCYIGSERHDVRVGFEKYKLGVTPAMVNPAHTFNGFNLKMIPPTDVFAVTSIPGMAVPSGKGVVVTGQLSGCCLVYSNIGGLTLAHLQPGGARGATGLQLQDAIEKGGRFAGRPLVPVMSWGAKDYGQGGKASVVAVNNGSGWQIFGQVQSGGTSVTRVEKLL